MIERRLLEYILGTLAQSDDWWATGVPGTRFSRKDQLAEYRARYAARRSVAGLDRDSKDDPYPRSSNIGVGVEQIFGEFLTPTVLANSHDLEPQLQAIDPGTQRVEDALTAFHDQYHRIELQHKRQQLEESLREIWTVGSVFHKWTYESIWAQSEVSLPVFVHPLSQQPMMVPDPQTGQLTIMPADPKMPEEHYPVDPATGIPLKLGKVGSVEQVLKRHGPQLAIRPIEQIGFSPTATTVDPTDWDYLFDRFAVSPWWFLGREGDPFEGKLQNLPKLWKLLGVNPNEVHRRPDGKLTQAVQLVEWHGKFPVTSSGRPAELIALVAWEHKLLLGWRVSKLPRRPYFNRQVYSRGGHPLGKGIPETTYGLRSALDASVNQDVDSGNIWNHPPVLLSDLAMLEDEDYEIAGPGTQWVMRDINGAKVLAVPPATRNPIERENWLVSMTQRLWGVTDINLSAPTSSLSPNVSTATGVTAILNQATVKFGHLTRRITETDTQEFQFCHDLFRLMLSAPKLCSVKGQPYEIKPEQREQFFKESIRIISRGNGISTNPMVRQQVFSQAYGPLMANPFVGQDLEVAKDFTEQFIEAFGIQLTLKDPQLLQQIQLFQQLMQTPAGQQLIPEAMQNVIKLMQATPMAGEVTPEAQNGNRMRANVAAG